MRQVVDDLAGFTQIAVDHGDVGADPFGQVAEALGVRRQLHLDHLVLGRGQRALERGWPVYQDAEGPTAAEHVGVFGQLAGRRGFAPQAMDGKTSMARETSARSVEATGPPPALRPSAPSAPSSASATPSKPRTRAAEPKAWTRRSSMSRRSRLAGSSSS